MMDDLAELQSRVQAARDRLGDVESDQRKYGLRLDDLVRIVEGALSRQSEELKAARIRSASLQTELDDARNALSRAEVDLAARETDLARLGVQNEQLRTMVMTLLELVEGRSATPMREAMVRLEHGVRNLITEATGKAPSEDRRRPEKKPPEMRETPRPAPAPLSHSGPMLVPNQTVQGRIPMPSKQPMPAPLDESGEALVELTSFGRSNADETVKEPPFRESPEGSGASVSSITPMRRIAGDAVAAPALPDA
ncbi:MAG TPA: hypothetical protein VHE77_11080 [Dongiaceae bacterium]|jgi:hypothetical protein|nr:hypothetical protein [Dongiaceae bacterium]